MERYRSPSSNSPSRGHFSNQKAKPNESQRRTSCRSYEVNEEKTSEGLCGEINQASEKRGKKTQRK